MIKLLKVLFVCLALTLSAVPAFPLSYEIDVGQDGIFETGGSINMNVGESVIMDIYLDSYSCLPDEQLCGAKIYITLNESQVSVSVFPYDIPHGGPFHSEFCGLWHEEPNVYHLEASDAFFVTVVGNKQKLGTITLTSTSIGTFMLVVAEDLTSYGYPSYNDGFVADCNYFNPHPQVLHATDALLTVVNESCETDGDCNDNDLCTIDACYTQINECVFTPVVCDDDGVFCNGVEICNADDGTCIHPGNPCIPPTICDEGLNICLPDTDVDGIYDYVDNCSTIPNSSTLGTCVRAMNGVIVGMGTTCTDDGDCATDQTCDLVQGDHNDNGCGDACECYADIVGTSGKVDLSDLVELKKEYNRTDCDSNPCLADMNGDDKVGLPDLTILKVQYNRTGCPACP